MSGHAHRYHVGVEWTGNRGSGTDGYRSYGREHVIRIEGKPDIAGSSDPAFRGDASRHNPEDMLVAALSTCHMLAYLHVAMLAGVVVTAYTDSAEGTMVTEGNGGRFTEVVLRPVVTITATSDPGKAKAAHADAHHACFIAGSVNFPVRCEPRIVVEEPGLEIRDQGFAKAEGLLSTRVTSRISMSPEPAVSNPESRIPNPGNKAIVLAFSGGLDTSFCVPYLKERGWSVHTVFADTGGVDDAERAYIESRAVELGVASHVTVDGGPALWQHFVKPFVWAGEGYQGQYPLLVSDRYLIVEAAVQRTAELGTRAIAHGCTGMGNDQVRFDLTVKALGDYAIVAPIREIQREHTAVRAYEQQYLAERGFAVRTKQQAYTINENLLGVTLSGGEIDRWETPGEGARGWCAPRAEWPAEPLRVRIGFERGEATSLDGESVAGPALLAQLNARFARYGVGRGIYTGDTTIGLKGRIVYEAPGLVALLTAHRALEDAVLTKHQNRFKPEVARRWVELVYEGFFHDPLKADLEAFLASSQRCVSGEVTLETRGGSVESVAVASPHILAARGATYAQAADWGVAEAEGFIKLYGMSSGLWTEVNRNGAR